MTSETHEPPAASLASIVVPWLLLGAAVYLTWPLWRQILGSARVRRELAALLSYVNPRILSDFAGDIEAWLRQQPIGRIP